MKLWLISQTTNSGYDTFDSAVVAAADESAAKLTHPSPSEEAWHDTGACDRDYGTWTSKENVVVEYLGEAGPGIEAGVICASFNAG